MSLRLNKETYYVLEKFVVNWNTLIRKHQSKSKERTLDIKPGVLTDILFEGKHAFADAIDSECIILLLAVQ